MIIVSPDIVTRVLLGVASQDEIVEALEKQERDIKRLKAIASKAIREQVSIKDEYEAKLSNVEMRNRELLASSTALREEARAVVNRLYEAVEKL